MAARGSKISRTIAYFKDAELEEARVVFQRVNEIMQERLTEAMGLPAAKRARTKRSRPAAPAMPTKAELNRLEAQAIAATSAD